MKGCAEVNAYHQLYTASMTSHESQNQGTHMFGSEAQPSYAIHALGSTVQIFNTNPHHTWARSSTSTTTAHTSQPTAGSHSSRQSRLYRSKPDLADPCRATFCVFSASSVFPIPDESHRATSSHRVSDTNESVLDHPFLAVDQEIFAESPENSSYRQRTCMAFVHLHVRVDRPRRMCDTC